MYSVNNDYINACKSLSRQFNGKLVVGTTNLYSDDIQSFKIEYSIGNSDKYTIGASNASKLSVKLVKDGNNLPVVYSGKIIPYIGLLVNGSYTFIKMGEFYIKKSTLTSDKVSVSFDAYDKMFSYGYVIYNRPNYTTTREMLTELSTKFDVSIDAITTYDNLPLKADFNGMTVRNIISELATVMGKNAVIDRNGVLRFIKYNNTTFTTDGHNSSKFVLGDNSKISKVTIENADSTSYSKGDTTGCELKVQSSNITTQSEVNSLYTRIGLPFNYTAMTLNMQGFPFIDCGDKFTYTNSDNVVYDVYAITHTITYNGGCVSEIKVKASTEEQTVAKTSISANIANISKSVDGLQTNIVSTDEEVSQLLEDMGVLQDTVDNIQVGGTNLLKKTKEFEIADGSSYLNGVIHNGTSVRSLDLLSTSTSTYKEFAQMFNTVMPEYSEEEFTLSFYATGIGKLDCYFHQGSPNVTVCESSDGTVNIGNSDGHIEIQLTSLWKRYWIKFTLGTATTMSAKKVLFRLFGGNAVSMCSVKLEKGNYATDWSPAPDDTDNKIESAFATANNKNKIFYSDTTPVNTTSYTLRINDMWFKTDEGNKIYQYNGEAWIEQPLGDAAVKNLSAGSITSGQFNGDRIASNEIISRHIRAGAIESDKIAANAITTNKLATDAIKSLNYVENEAGTFLDLNTGNFYLNDSEHYSGISWDYDATRNLHLNTNRLNYETDNVLKSKTSDHIIENVYIGNDIPSLASYYSSCPVVGLGLSHVSKGYTGSGTDMYNYQQRMSMFYDMDSEAFVMRLDDGADHTYSSPAFRIEQVEKTGGGWTQTGFIEFDGNKITTPVNFSTEYYPQIRGDGTYLHLSHNDNKHQGIVIENNCIRPAYDCTVTLGNSNFEWNDFYTQQINTKWVSIKQELKFTGTNYPQIVGNGSYLQMGVNNLSSRGMVLELSMLRPASYAGLDLGNSNYPFSTVFYKNLYQVSDLRKKTDIEELSLEKSKSLICGLKPITYIYKDEDKDIAKTNWGLGSQDVEQLLATMGLTDKDFNGLKKLPDGDDFSYGLDYTQFITPLIKVVQGQQKELEEKDKKINELESRLEAIEKKLGITA